MQGKGNEEVTARQLQIFLLSIDIGSNFNKVSKVTVFGISSAFVTFCHPPEKGHKILFLQIFP